MAGACNLEVDVNGEAIFLVDKEVLSSFSGRLRKLFGSLSVTSHTKNLKIIFHDLPGGAEGFELMARYCYDNGRIVITPGNACLLNSVAHYLEMTDDVSSSSNLIEQTDKYMEGMPYWSWTEIVSSLKRCGDLSPADKSLGMIDRLVDSLVGRITTASDASPAGSSPESSAFRFSCDSKSTASARNANQRAWWFDDLTTLKPNMVERVVRNMLAQKVEHAVISRFLFHYLKDAVSAASSSDKKRKASEAVIDMLHCLDRSSIPCKGLFGVLRVCSSLNLSESCRSRLESMIGSQIDRATLDNLLIPSRTTVDGLYDVSLVLRFLKSFLNSRDQVPMSQLKRAGSLMDSYLAEVAPDATLKPLKFMSLTTCLPDAARDSHDAIYRAIDMYLEVHTELCEEDKMKICGAINYEKLSSESCKHLARNTKFPSRTAIRALFSQQSKLKSLLKDTNNVKKLGTACPNGKRCKENQCDEAAEQVVLYAKKLNLSVENEKLKAHLQGMQWKVMELEKVCRKMQTQIAKVAKTGGVSSPISSNSKSLPRLCS